MISEMALKRATRPAVLGRGQVIAWREGRIWSRRIAYDGSLTRLSVHVDSSSGYEDFYQTRITIDEVASYGERSWHVLAREVGGDRSHA